MISPIDNPTDHQYAMFTCPKCGALGIIDKDQFEGKVSMICPSTCGFHETIDSRIKP